MTTAHHAWLPSILL